MTMTIPSVMFLEMAMDSLKGRDPRVNLAEIKEFDFLGEKRKTDILCMVAGNDPMAAGYLLGLETARVLLATSIAAVNAGVSI